MWAILILASLSALIVFALLVPLEIVMRVDVYGRPKFRMRLVWLFGLVSKEIARKEQKVAEDKRKSGEGKAGSRAILEILRTKGLLRQTKRLLISIFRIARIRAFLADFRVGLGDPADTGLLFALIGPATFFLDSSFPNQIKVRASFSDETVLEGSLHGALRLRPIQLVPPLLRFVFSLPTIRMAKIVVVTKWRRKKLKLATP